MTGERIFTLEDVLAAREVVERDPEIVAAKFGGNGVALFAATVAAKESKGLWLGRTRRALRIGQIVRIAMAVGYGIARAEAKRLAEEEGDMVTEGAR